MAWEVFVVILFCWDGRPSVRLGGTGWQHESSVYCMLFFSVVHIFPVRMWPSHCVFSIYFHVYDGKKYNFFCCIVVSVRPYGILEKSVDFFCSFYVYILDYTLIRKYVCHAKISSMEKTKKKYWEISVLHNNSTEFPCQLCNSVRFRFGVCVVEFWLENWEKESEREFLEIAKIQ